MASAGLERLPRLDEAVLDEADAIDYLLRGLPVGLRRQRIEPTFIER